MLDFLLYTQLIHRGPAGRSWLHRTLLPLAGVKAALMRVFQHPTGMRLPLPSLAGARATEETNDSLT